MHKGVDKLNQGVLLDEIERLADLLDLKLVDKSKCCVDRKVYEAYRTLATAAVSEPDKLQWDES